MAESNPGLPDQSSSFGKAFFIVNREFDTENPDNKCRSGTEKDFEYMKKSFLRNGMGFTLQNTQPHFRNDVTLLRWDHSKRSGRQLSSIQPADCCLKCHIQSLDYSTSQCFLLAASSHGNQIDDEPVVVLSDGNCLKLSEIFDTISDENCPTLKGKIKLIVIQACRTGGRDQPDSDKDDDGMIVYIASDGQSHNSTGQVQASASQASSRRTPAHHKDLFNVPQDVIVIFPSAAGKVSKRHPEGGSWMLEEFAKVIQKARKNPQNSGIDINFLKIVTVVSGCISRRETQSEKNPGKRGKKNTVCSYHRLTQPFYFQFSEPVDTTSNESNADKLDFEANTFEGQKKKKKKKLSLDDPSLNL